MRRRITIPALAALLACWIVSRPASADGPATGPASRPADPVKIIFDTDMDSDCDDVGALAVLHALADNGEADILATVVSTPTAWPPPCVDAINTYYARPDLPIGCPKKGGGNKPSKYARAIADKFPQD